jgi:5,10-methylenetetrahydromethanopterin reductase
MAGLDPVISRGTVREEMAGSSPATTGTQKTFAVGTRRRTGRDGRDKPGHGGRTEDLCRRHAALMERVSPMTSLRVAIRVPVGRPLPEVAAFAARCEDAGFDGVGIHDHPSSGRDAYLALALAAQGTKRLRLFPATSSPVVRHPLVLASLAHSLEEIAPGRAMLTVAPGFLSTRSIGQPRAPLRVMREAILDLRRLLAGGEVGFGPTPIRLRNRSDTPTPVYLLAAGPRMMELAGEVADGAFVMAGLHADSIRAARRHLQEGAKRAGRDPNDFPVVFVVTFGLGPDAEVGARWVRSWFAPGQPFLAYPSVANLRWLGEAGFAIDEVHDPAAIPEDRAHQIADAFGMFGSPERCADRLIRAREEAGVDDVFLFPAHDLAGGYAMPEAEVQAFERVIHKRLGG